ncbi:MAG: hypothetical protein ACT4QG_18250 [Sporichthyaceae bacterium]
MSRRSIAALALVATVAACGSEKAAPTSATRPADLVGLWRVGGTGIPAQTYLRMDPGNRVFLFQACGSPFGQWRAVPGGALAFMLVVSAPDCAKVDGVDEWERNTPAWLRSVANFRTAGDRRLLLDPAGREVAGLTPVPEAPGSDLPGERVAPPPPTQAERDLLDRAVAPPGGMRRADPRDLVGRWETPDRAAGVFVEFGEGGTLHLRDGCNSGRGRWSLGAGGSLAAVLSLSYVVACKNAPIAAWLQSATWAGIDNSGLVVVDAAGKVVGTLLKV